MGKRIPTVSLFAWGSRVPVPRHPPQIAVCPLSDCLATAARSGATSGSRTDLETYRRLPVRCVGLVTSRGGRLYGEDTGSGECERARRCGASGEFLASRNSIGHNVHYRRGRSSPRTSKASLVILTFLEVRLGILTCSMHPCPIRRAETEQRGFDPIERR
jgi:hypothetical protein